VSELFESNGLGGGTILGDAGILYPIVTIIVGCL